MKLKYMVNIVTPIDWQIACLSGSGHLLDTDYSGYQFNIFSVSPLYFCEKLQEIEKWVNNNNHLSSGRWIIETSRSYDSLCFTYHSGGTLSISRGGLKVLFHGSAGLVFSSIPAIQKAYQKYNKIFYES